MDIGTINDRIEKGFYSNAQLAIDDFELIFENCFKYNYPTCDVFKMGKSVLNFFRASISRMPQYKESVSNAESQHPHSHHYHTPVTESDHQPVSPIPLISSNHSPRSETPTPLMA